jgi:hypothetical protein
MAGPPHREPDHLLADRETADTRTQFDHYARQVAALPGRKRRGKQIAYGARANCRLTDIYARCFDLDQNLTCSRNGAGHVAHLKDVDAPVRIELKCPSHERLNEYDRAGIPSRHHTQPIAASAAPDQRGRQPIIVPSEVVEGGQDDRRNTRTAMADPRSARGPTCPLRG